MSILFLSKKYGQHTSLPEYSLTTFRSSCLLNCSWYPTSSTRTPAATLLSIPTKNAWKSTTIGKDHTVK